MLSVHEQRKPLSDEIKITIHMASGDVFEQPLPYEMAEAVQHFMDWYRNPGKTRIWTWQAPSDMSMHLFHHSHIAAIDVDGYIELDGRESRWYEILFDRIRARWFRG